MQVRPKKRLGQHFLTDLSIARRIADTVDACPDIPVLEVGPGMGVMTQFLKKKGRLLKVVEIDEDSVEYLRKEYPGLEDNIIEDDFLKMHLERTFGDNGRFVLTGNYPYNISSQIFFKMLDNKDLIPCCTGTVDENVFSPPPKVKSAVVRLMRNARTELGCNESLFRAIVKSTFNQRRKTLRNSMKQVVADGSAFLADRIFDLRPEQLSIEQFIELTNEVEHRCELKTTVNVIR